MLLKATKMNFSKLTCLKMSWFQKKQAPNWTYQKKMRYGSLKLQLSALIYNSSPFSPRCWIATFERSRPSCYHSFLSSRCSVFQRITAMQWIIISNDIYLAQQFFFLLCHEGRTIIFWRGRWRVGKFWNKLFAEAVNTEINCMQVKKVFAGRRRHTKKIVCSSQQLMKKNCLHVKIFQPPPPSPLRPPTPVKKIMVRPFLVLCHLETQKIWSIDWASFTWWQKNWWRRAFFSK